MKVAVTVHVMSRSISLSLPPSLSPPLSLSHNLSIYTYPCKCLSLYFYIQVYNYALRFGPSHWMNPEGNPSLPPSLPPYLQTLQHRGRQRGRAGPNETQGWRIISRGGREGGREGRGGREGKREGGCDEVTVHIPACQATNTSLSLSSLPPSLPTWGSPSQPASRALAASLAPPCTRWHRGC
jgi:hypothetical protein